MNSKNKLFHLWLGLESNMMEMNIYNLKIYLNTLKLQKNYLKKVLLINVIVLRKKLMNKKKNVKNKGYLMFTIENGEMPRTLKFQRMLNQLLDLKVKFLECPQLKI